MHLEQEEEDHWEQYIIKKKKRLITYLLKAVHAGTTSHGSMNANDTRISFRLCYQCIRKVVGVRLCLQDKSWCDTSIVGRFTKVNKKISFTLTKERKKTNKNNCCWFSRQHSHLFAAVVLLAKKKKNNASAQNNKNHTFALDFFCWPVMVSYCVTPCILSEAVSAGRYPRPFSVTTCRSTGPTVSVVLISA